RLYFKVLFALYNKLGVKMELHIDIKEQKLMVYKENCVYSNYDVSTASAGVGQLKNSYQTPLGWHYVRAMIGANAESGSVFRGRRFTGEILDEKLFIENPNRDWILTRIIWLSGL